MNIWEPGLVVVGIGADARRARGALRYAAQEANRRRAGVLLFHACTPSWSLGSLEPVLPLEEREKKGMMILRTAAKRLRPLLEPGLQVGRHVFQGTAVDGLLSMSTSASLIVVQRRGVSSLRHLTTGSTSSTLAARATCPVVIVRQDHDLAGGSGVVVGVDDAAHAVQALPTAFEEALLRKTTVTAVHVWSSENALTAYGWEPQMSERMADLQDRARKELVETVAGHAQHFPGVVVHHEVVEGPVVAALLRVSESAQLLVLGRHGRSHVGSLALGGVVRLCLSAARCPVVVTPTGRRSSRASQPTSVAP